MIGTESQIRTFEGQRVAMAPWRGALALATLGVPAVAQQAQRGERERGDDRSKQGHCAVSRARARSMALARFFSSMVGS